MNYLKEFAQIGFWELDDNYKSNKSLRHLNLKGINFRIDKEFENLKNAVYVFKTGEDILYIGETTRGLKSRFESYRYGFDKFKDTDNRVKIGITNNLENGLKIHILYYQPKTLFKFAGQDIEIPISKPIEEFLISNIKTSLNIKSNKFVVDTIEKIK